MVTVVAISQKKQRDSSFKTCECITARALRWFYYTHIINIFRINTYCIYIIYMNMIYIYIIHTYILYNYTYDPLFTKICSRVILRRASASARGPCADVMTYILYIYIAYILYTYKYQYDMLWHITYVYIYCIHIHIHINMICIYICIIHVYDIFISVIYISPKSAPETF